MYKENKEVTVDISNKSKKGFCCLCITKIIDVELKEDYIWTQLDCGEIAIYQGDEIGYLKRRGRVFKNRFQIGSEEYDITIDTEECDN